MSVTLQLLNQMDKIKIQGNNYYYINYKQSYWNNLIKFIK